MPFWKNALLELFTEPEKFTIVDQTSDFWVIQDKYPKAQIHLLVVPKVKIIKGVTSLDRSHLPLVNAMSDYLVRTGYDGPNFLVGFHALPSLFQLHLHIVSRDLRGCKHKKHRNSFTPDFMLNLEQVMQALTDKGQVVVDQDHYKQVLAR